MSWPLLAFALILGSLSVLTPQPATGFTIKLLGDENSFGEGPVAGDVDKEDEGPIPYDDKPGDENSFGEGPVAGDVDKEDEGPIPYDDKPGDENSFGQGPVAGDVDEEDEGPIPYDDKPGSDEISLHMLGAAKQPMPIADIDGYLRKYGYLAAPANGSVSEHERKEAIREFQRFAGLEETGVMDIPTRTQMLRPRCGMADPVPNSIIANYVAKVGKWSKKDLTYRIFQYSKKVPNTIARKWLAKSFKMWSDVSQLTFTEVETGPVDIKVRFSPTKHNDNNPFDGKGGVLAHAFYPQSGEIHMDESEKWTVQTSRGTNLLSVFVHEIGHALGLGHSKARRAIMEPYYNKYKPNFALHRDDIAGIQFLYGKPDPKFPCPFKFWAAMTVGKTTYGFYKRTVYEILPNGKVTRPRKIASVFPGAPWLVLAAAHDEISGHTFLFQGRRVFRYTNNKLDKGFPKRLNAYIRAAVVVDEELIAFSFRHIHILDEDTMEDYVDGDVTLEEEYPGLPRRVKSMVSYGGDYAYVIYRNKVIKLDVFSGAWTEERCDK